MAFEGWDRGPMSIFVSAGEVSGDIAGSHLATALRSACPQIILSGAGGKRMEEAGVRILFNTNHFGSWGLTEPLATIPGLFKTFKGIRRHVNRQRPDAAVLIGHDVFHLFLARWLKKKRIPTFAYFPPQVWLWRKLARPVANSFDWMLTSFPEEYRVYERAGGRVVFVGHYLLDGVEEVTSGKRERARRNLGLQPEQPVVGLFPGSRVQELHTLLPAFLGAVQRLNHRQPSIQFVLAVSDPFFEDTIREAIGHHQLEESIRLTWNSQETLIASDLVLATSGTATLEAALLGVPMVIVYRLSLPSLLAVKVLALAGLIESETVGLPNLLADRQVVPELHQREVSPSKLSKVAFSILMDRERQSQMREDLKPLRLLLGNKGGLQRAARVILEQAATNLEKDG